MEFKSGLNYSRVSAQKARLVVDMVRGKKVEDALNTIRFLNKKTAELLTKLINSAVSNASNQSNVNIDKLYIKEIYVNQGPVLKRFRPRAQGRAFGVRKKTSHINLVLDER